MEQTRGSLIGAGPATEEETDEQLRNVDSQQLDLATSPMVPAWGAARAGQASDGVGGQTGEPGLGRAQHPLPP